jgi:ribonuclease HI
MIKKIYVNADGGARGNPGRAAIGIIIRDESKILESFRECIGEATNNVAEYKALIKALELAAGYTRKEVQVFMDSEFVVKQVGGEYRIKKKHLMSLFQEVKKCEGMFEKVVYNHVPRGNRFQAMADRLVNEALDDNEGNN